MEKRTEKKWVLSLVLKIVFIGTGAHAQSFCKGIEAKPRQGEQLKSDGRHTALFDDKSAVFCTIKDEGSQDVEKRIAHPSDFEGEYDIYTCQESQRSFHSWAISLGRYVLIPKKGAKTDSNPGTKNGCICFIYSDQDFRSVLCR